MIERSRNNVRWKLIRQTVQELHNHLRALGDYQAPIPVDKLARSLGVKLAFVPSEDDDLSGFFYRDPISGESVIGVNAAHAKTRQRFTIAHELGHLKLHSFEDLHFDRKGRGGIFRRSAESSTGENREEIEANTFAAELLMPEDLIYDKLEALSEFSDIFERDFDGAIREMARQFTVSPQALTIRMTQLGIISIE